jgi:hypothetical protein
VVSPACTGRETQLVLSALPKVTMLSCSGNHQSFLVGANGKALPPATLDRPPKAALLPLNHHRPHYSGLSQRNPRVSSERDYEATNPTTKHHSWHNLLLGLIPHPNQYGANVAAGSRGIVSVGRQPNAQQPSPPTSTHSWTPTPDRPSKQVGGRAVVQRCGTLAAGIQPQLTGPAAR